MHQDGIEFAAPAREAFGRPQFEITVRTIDWLKLSIWLCLIALPWSVIGFGISLLLDSSHSRAPEAATPTLHATLSPR
jgi:hypothetical protein